MRPVPKFTGTSVRDPHRGASGNDQPANLVWRKSEQVAPPAPAKVAAQRSTSPTNRLRADDSESLQLTAPTGTPLTQGAAGVAPEIAAISPLRPQSVRQAQFELPSASPTAPQSPAPPSSAANLPPTLQGPALQPPAQASPSKPLPDFFEEPFGEANAPVPNPAAELPPATPAMPVPAPQPQPLSPAPGVPELPLPNALRRPAAEESPAPALPAPAFELPAEPEPVPAPLPSLREPRQVPDQPIPDPAIVPLFPDLGGRSPSPSQLGEPNKPGVDRIQREIEDFDTRSPGLRPGGTLPQRTFDDLSSVQVAAFSCDDFRRNIAQATIRTISLDISPPFRPDVIEMDEFDKLRGRFQERQQVRDWTSLDGKKLGRGRLRDLAYEKALIETEFGTVEELPLAKLTEADLSYITEQWGLPQECLIEQVAYQPRQWVESKITWKASNLMHNTLYFEDVNLERYGQTPGPILEPLVSSAHFFANIAVLPYKMGVHKPSECQYALGYYRPGDCAPWIVPPVPISLRGAIYQAGAITGTFWLVP